jgi:hypothetical protein
MGIVDPMVFNSAAAVGVLEFGFGPVLFWLIVGPLAALGAAIAISGLHLERLARLKPPKLVHAQLVAASVSRAK